MQCGNSKARVFSAAPNYLHMGHCQAVPICCKLPFILAYNWMCPRAKVSSSAKACDLIAKCLLTI
eukprot:706181-Pelagomonas_calceolata.AAC.2